MTATDTTTTALMPVLDVQELLTPSAEPNFVQRLGDAFLQVGFFAVVNHDVPLELFNEVYSEAARFFALEDSLKRRYERPATRGTRGYAVFAPRGSAPGTEPEWKEGWTCGRELAPDDPNAAVFGNPWPAEAAGFQAKLSALYRALEGCAMSLLDACSLFLELPRPHFRGMSSGANSIMRILHYPALLKEVPLPATRTRAHEDLNLLTLLGASTEDGLELQRVDGSWEAIKLPPGSLVVNAGHLMHQATAGLFQSRPHRVMSREPIRASRLSIPFFVHARQDAELRPPAVCLRKAGLSSDGSAMSAGEFFSARLKDVPNY